MAEPKTNLPEKCPVNVGARGLMPTTMTELFRLAECISQSRLAPKALDTPAKILVAMQIGMEIGFSPMQALQSMAVINGKASVGGDGALALVRASGLLESISSGLDGEDDSPVAWVETIRKGDKSPLHTRFSVDDAKKAGLWEKAGPWSQYPKRMLYYRALAFNLRDNFPDVLKGVRVAEEQRDVQPEGVSVVSDDPPEPQKDPLLEEALGAEVVDASFTNDEPTPEPAKEESEPETVDEGTGEVSETEPPAEGMVPKMQALFDYIEEHKPSKKGLDSTLKKYGYEHKMEVRVEDVPAILKELNGLANKRLKEKESKGD